MARYSKRQLAQGFLKLGKKHAFEKIMPVLAAFVKQANLKRETELVVQEIAREAWQQESLLLATVTSAREISGMAEGKIEEWLKGVTDAQSLAVEYQVRPEVVGGIKITLPQGVFDATVLNKLEQLN